MESIVLIIVVLLIVDCFFGLFVRFLIIYPTLFVWRKMMRAFEKGLSNIFSVNSIRAWVPKLRVSVKFSFLVMGSGRFGLFQSPPIFPKESLYFKRRSDSSLLNNPT